ncbi:MAG: nucleotidyltransferase [Acetatifactor sp.]|nr:nucleotidyltransferase [Acetatifactor sp.]
MKINAIIAEYNPFHTGHAYQIRDAKEATGADHTIVIMSGNFVQRGTPALFDKHLRTQAALLNSADLVLELPAIFSTASAEYFAYGAVSLLNALGCVNHLCFGSESGDLDLLRKVAETLVQEPETYKTALKEALASGNSFPKARELALSKCHQELSGTALLGSPNNILALEYMKALCKTNSSMEPYTTRRAGSGYHDDSLDASFASATALRGKLAEDSTTASVKQYIPDNSCDLYDAYLTQYQGVNENDFSSMLYYRLLSLAEVGYTQFLDVSEEISNRIQKHLPEYKGFTSFCELLKTKEVTYSRISRCLLHILLDVRKLAPGSPKIPGYVRVLGFRKDAAPLLSELGKCSSLQLLTKPADAKALLSERDLALFRQQLFADSLYEQVLAAKSGCDPRNEITIPITIV